MLYQRPCPGATSGPTPTIQEYNALELTVFNVLFNCTADMATNPPNSPCPELVYLPDKSFASLFPSSCFDFNLAKPQANTEYAICGLVLFIIEFGAYLWFLTRRHVQPIKHRDPILTFITFATSFANSVIPFGPTVYGLGFPVGFLIYAEYISAPLTTGSLAFRCYQFWFKYKWMSIPTKDPRRLFWAKWAWTTRLPAFILWMIPYFIYAMILLAINYHLFPQDFQDNPFIFSTGRCDWFYFGPEQVAFLTELGLNSTLLPSPYNPQGYVPYSPHFSSCTVYPSTVLMNNMSTVFLAVHCFVLFMWAWALYGKPEKLFIRGELWFMIADILTVVVLIIWSGWPGWAGAFTPNGFNLSNMFYIFNALLPWIGSVLMPLIISYTRTFDRHKGFIPILGETSTTHSGTHNIRSLLGRYFRKNDVISMTSTEEKTLQVLQLPYVGSKYWFCRKDKGTPIVNSRGERICLKLTGLEPRTLFDNPMSIQLTQELAMQLFIPELIAPAHSHRRRSRPD